MNNSIQTFKFENNTVRTIEIDNTIWFVAKDVATALGYSNTRDAILTHCRKPKSLIDIRIDIRVAAGDASKVDTGSPLSPENQMKMILESDVYRLILKSNLPSAERFQDWIVEEVLPSIRHTGSYNIVPVNNQNLQVHEMLDKFLELQSKAADRENMLLELQSKAADRENMLIALQSQTLELQSKAAEREKQYLDLISKFDEKIEYEKYKSSVITMFELSYRIEFEKYINLIKELSNINVRANFNEVTLKLYLHQSVKDHEKIFKSNGLPYEKYIDNGFYIVENGEISKVYITRKGSDHLFWFLKSKKLIS